MAGFIFNDAFVKLASADLPTGEILFFRGLFALSMLSLIGFATGNLSGLTGIRHRVVGWRLVGEVGATVFYLTALFHMPIANATMILQAVPLLVTAAAAIFLGDRVGWRRWIAVGAGFLGVALIVRPGPEGFDIWVLSALAAICFITLRDLATRRMPAKLTTFHVTFATTTAVALLGLAMSPFEDWSAPTSRHLMLLAAAAVFILIGYFFIIAAIRIADMAVVAPFRYSIVLWALVIGFVVWGDVPDALTLIGTAIVIATGVYTFHRERIAARQAAKKPG